MEEVRAAPGPASGRVIVGLDFERAELALKLVERLNPDLCALKIGKELFTAEGPDLVRQLVDRGYRVFLDLKYHDIPNTVARAVSAAARLGVWMVNVHASGGAQMLRAAREALEVVPHRPLLTAVTVLTSMDEAALNEVGIPDAPLKQVRRLATLACACGLDGVVSSAWEAHEIKDFTRPDFLTVTPGIRPSGSANADQKRVMTPYAAILNKADYLVVGRPITAAADPLTVLAAINAEIARALSAD